MTQERTSDERRTDIALARYTLILPMVREPSPQQRRQMRQNMAATLHEFPHTLRNGVSANTLYRWEKAWRAGGFEALKPRPRHDRGQTRVVSAETLDRAETLKREQPFRSARSIIHILTTDATHPIPEDRLSERTLRRHLARRDATTAQLVTAQRPKPYRRFACTRHG